MKSHNSVLSNPIYLGASSLLIGRAKELRRKMTNEERLVWEKLRNNQIGGFKFRRQHPILFFIVDFYCHQRKLAVEIDGGYHNDIQQAEFDKGRSDELNNFGIKVIRFTNEEVLNDIENVVTRIKGYLLI